KLRTASATCLGATASGRGRVWLRSTAPPPQANSCWGDSTSSGETISPTTKQFLSSKEVTRHDRRRTKTGRSAQPHSALEALGTLSQRARMGNGPRRLQPLRNRLGLFAA